MFDNLPAELLWFILGLFLLLAELAVPAFIVVFFGIGAWVTSLVTLLGFAPSLAIQIVIFLGVSVLTLVLFRNKAKRFGRGRVSVKTHEGHDISSVAGSTAIVTEDIEAGKLGKVELFGTSWQATADVTIKKGTTVEVVSRDNLTLKVRLR